ncbi:MAG: exodeoxyribonuclease III [Propionibacteriaceae bacterium]|nr:exodeoxyribonuclease III [Propionibacteriaceae bacterium]
MRIATFNVNGIRAAVRRGFGAWLADAQPDILALQEMRCPAAEVPPVFSGYHLSYFPGNLPGRNGVALACRERPAAVREGFGYRDDAEGRYLEADFDGLTVGCLYLPKGGVLGTGDPAEDRRYHRKQRFMKSFRAYLGRARRAALGLGREFTVMGDFNIAHERLDLKNWRSNQQNDGFLPEEREWFGSILGPRTLVDVVRRLHPGEAGPYSWWSWRGQAFANDAGWRIDYQLATPGLAARAAVAGTHRDPSYESRISDHAPVVVEYR